MTFSGFRVSGLGLGVWGLGFGDHGASVDSFWVLFRVYRFRVWGFRVHARRVGKAWRASTLETHN